MRVENVLVVGAGIGGLAAATAFAQRGASVEVAEIQAELGDHGVGINQPANALRALREIGVADECMEVGFPFDRSTFCDWKGNLIVDVPSVLGDGKLPANNALPRRELHRILTTAAERAGAKIRLGVTVDALGPLDADRVEVAFTDGRTDRYDLVVAFDGIGSPMRRRLFAPDPNPVYTGFAVWRVTVPRPADVTNLMLFQGDRTKAGLVPLSQDSMYLLHVTPDPGHPHHDPQRFDVLLRDRLAGYEGLIGELREAITAPDGIVYSPISEVILPGAWHRGRVVVLGDAAHACVPHLTQGAGMALEDAVVLAEMLDGGARSTGSIVETLAAFTQRRRPRTALAQDASRAVLMSEMEVTAATLPAAARHMRESLPGRIRAVETVLNQPF